MLRSRKVIAQCTRAIRGDRTCRRDSMRNVRQMHLSNTVSRNVPTISRDLHTSGKCLYQTYQNHPPYSPNCFQLRSSWCAGGLLLRDSLLPLQRSINRNMLSSAGSVRGNKRSNPGLSITDASNAANRSEKDLTESHLERRVQDLRDRTQREVGRHVVVQVRTIDEDPEGKTFRT